MGQRAPLRAAFTCDVQAGARSEGSAATSYVVVAVRNSSRRRTTTSRVMHSADKRWYTRCVPAIIHGSALVTCANNPWLYSPARSNAAAEAACVSARRSLGLRSPAQCPVPVVRQFAVRRLCPHPGPCNVTTPWWVVATRAAPSAALLAEKLCSRRHIAAENCAPAMSAADLPRHRPTKNFGESAAEVRRLIDAHRAGYLRLAGQPVSILLAPASFPGSFSNVEVIVFGRDAHDTAVSASADRPTACAGARLIRG